MGVGRASGKETLCEERREQVIFCKPSWLKSVLFERGRRTWCLEGEHDWHPLPDSMCTAASLCGRSGLLPTLNLDRIRSSLSQGVFSCLPSCSCKNKTCIHLVLAYRCLASLLVN